LALICNLVIVTARAKPPSPKAEDGPSASPKPASAPPAGDAADATDDDDEGDDGDDGAARSRAASDTGARAKRGTLAAYATGFTVAAWLALTAYLVVRTIATGHGPFANQHEFAVAFTWGIVAAYLLVEWRLRLRILSVAVLPVALALLAYGMRLDTEAVPLVPALQNSTLLTLHVGFAVAAYGAACVSFGGAACYLLYNKVGFLRAKDVEVYDILGYRAAVVTFPLLTTMIVLGALWADTAWGRYWGWDPKETAALVTWLIYGAYLHARIARGWRGKKSAWLLIIGFAAVLFAYFGNHFLGGLHSYA
ncbi:MAG: c-type cytochrome biogenesis protein CcsB, partial [Bifidobacteriaceae bacterium]|nr:c-type cytochrome biogenesis protein CcsB [Bifidobacteriaceae bacterium]